MSIANSKKNDDEKQAKFFFKMNISLSNYPHLSFHGSGF